MTQLLATNDGKLTINLHPGQTKAWDSSRRFIFIIAGTQSGKTSFEPLWLDREIKEKGEGDFLAVTATYDLLKMKFLPELQNYFCHLFGWGYSASERTIWKEYKPRLFTRIIMRSADAEGGLESSTAKAALFDECGQDGVKVSAWEAIQRRLSLSRGRVLGGTTPYNLGWLKTQVFDRWKKGDDNYQVIQFRSLMNPAFPRAEYYEQKAKLQTWKFEMFYNGEFSRPAGMIYEDFSQNHIIPAFHIPENWPRYFGVDFGGVHTAKLWLAKDPSTRIYYLYRELMEGNKTTQQHVDGVKEHNEHNLIAWGGAKSETQQRMDWTAAGLTVQEPLISDVEAGIDRVTALWKNYKLFVFDTCTGTIDEAGTYSRKLDDEGQPTEEIKNKKDYHHLDALRYVASGIDEADIDWSDIDGLGKIDGFKSRWE
jgi:hypothetical protein